MSNTKFQISLSNVILKKGHFLSKASTAQIVKNMHESVSQLKEEDENEFQKVLYPCLRTSTEKLVAAFEPLCTYTSETDRSVRFANLFTPLSKNANSGPVFHKRVRLTVNANFGPLIAALEQRVKYTLEKEVPKRYENNEDEGKSFEGLRKELNTFYDTLKEVIADYSATLVEARKQGEIDMDEVAQRRKEKREQKLQDRKQNTEGATVKATKGKKKATEKTASNKA